MARCYKCDRCGIVMVASNQTFIEGIEDYPEYYGDPAMTIYTKNKTYDICPDCARSILNLINKEKT